MIFSFIKLLQAFEAPEKAFKFMIRDIKYMTESTVCQMDEDYKQKANAVWRKRGEIEGKTRRHTARRDGIRINGLSLWRLRFLIETYRGWAQNEEYLQAGIVFMQERMASAFYFESTPPPVEEWDFVAMNNF